MKRAPEHWKLGIGGINRVLFPLSTLIFILIGKLILAYWQHTSLLLLASKLLLAMAAIRLIVYAVRYVTEPGECSKRWKIVFLALSGYLWHCI